MVSIYNSYFLKQLFSSSMDRDDLTKKYVKAAWTVDHGRCRRIESITIVDVSLIIIKPLI